MAKKQHKFLCLVLCLALVFSAVLAGTVSAFAAAGDTVYVRLNNGWSNVYCYMWSDSLGNNAAWPGVKMTLVKDNIYSYKLTKAFDKVIFDNGSGGNDNQTTDLTYPGKSGQIYDGSTWKVYDTSDLRVSSYTADPSSDIYPGMDVTLSAEAKNVNGATVYYKFSVTNAGGGTSVISNFSTAKTVTWTPSVAGSYTIKYDFMDTAGNENSRTLALTVADDSSVTKPIIKSVTPANLNLIKAGVANTVTVTAGGGKTGTNLLFYK